MEGESLAKNLEKHLILQLFFLVDSFPNREVFEVPQFTFFRVEVPQNLPGLKSLKMERLPSFLGSLLYVFETPFQINVSFVLLKYLQHIG